MGCCFTMGLIEWLPGRRSACYLIDWLLLSFSYCIHDNLQPWIRTTKRASLCKKWYQDFRVAHNNVYMLPPDLRLTHKIVDQMHTDAWCHQTCGYRVSILLDTQHVVPILLYKLHDTKYLVPSTPYHVSGSKYLVPHNYIIIIDNLYIYIWVYR